MVILYPKWATDSNQQWLTLVPEVVKLGTKIGSKIRDVRGLGLGTVTRTTNLEYP